MARKPGRGRSKGNSPAALPSPVEELLDQSITPTCAVHEGKCLYANPAFRQLFAIPPRGRVVGRPVLRYAAPAGRRQVAAFARARLRGRTGSGDLDCRALKADGSEFPVSIMVSPLRVRGGSPILLVQVLDRTAELTAEQALRESEERFRKLAETTSAAILIYQDLNVVYVNDAWTKISGYSLEEARRMGFWDTVHADDREIVKSRAQARLRGEPAPSRYDFRSLSKSGEVRWLEVSTVAIQMEGKPAVIGTAFDVTERKRAEEALRESEVLFRTLADMTSAAIFMYQGPKLSYVNEAWEKMIGYSYQEAVQRDFWDLVHPDDRELVKNRAMARLLGEKVPSRYEFRVITKGGEVRWADASAGVIQLEGKTTVIATAFDITDRKRVEETLRESEARFRELAETTSAAILIYQGPKVLYANEAWLNLTGYSREEVEAMGFWNAVHPDDRELVKSRALARSRGELVPARYEFRALTKSGEVRWLESSSGMTRIEGKPAVIATAFDVTERKWAEEAQRERETRYRLILENVEEIIWSVAIADDLMAAPALFISGQVESVIGYKPEEFYDDIGLWERIVHPDDLPSLRQITNQIAATGTARIREYRLKHKDTGEYHWMEDRATAQLDQKGRAVVLQGVARDVTDRRQAQAVLWQRNRELMALVASAQAMGGFLDLKAAAEAICDSAVKAFDMRLVWIGLVVPESTEIVPLATAGLDDGYTAQVRVTWDESPRSQGPIGRAIKTRRPVVMRAGDPDFAPWREAALSRGFAACCALPMVHEDAVRGALTFYSSDPEAFGTETMEVLEIFARQATMVVVNAALYEEARKIIGELSAANEELLKTQESLRRNIDELTRSREALRESEERYRGLVENARGIVLIFTPDLRITYWNEYAAEFFGFPREEILGRSVMGTIVPQKESTGRDLGDLLRRVAADPNAFASNINENVTRDGRRVWVAWTNRPIVDAQGRLVETLSHGVDITAFKEAEQALRESESRYRTLVESSRDCIFMIGRDGLVRYVNSFAANLFRSTPADLVGRPIEALFPAPSVGRMLENLQRAMDTGEPRDGHENRFLFPSGEIWLDTQLMPMRDFSGRVDAVLGVSRVITDRKRAGEALRESEARYRTLASISREAVVVADLSSRLTMVNEAALRLWGAQDADALLGQDGMQFIEERDRERAYEVMRQVGGAGLVRGVRYHIKRADGSTILIEVDAALLRGSSGEPTGVVSVMRKVEEGGKG